MKKVIFTLVIAFISSLSFISCTEEEISPITQTENGGGAFEEPVAR